jgi:predicted nucleotidyltransferase
MVAIGSWREFRVLKSSFSPISSILSAPITVRFTSSNRYMDLVLI